MLSVSDLCKEYQSEYGKHQVLEHLNLEVSTGEFVCITGRSGSGKSTLLNICAGILHPTSGAVLFEGENLYEKSDAVLSRFRNENLGYILQGYSVFPNMTVQENIEFPFYMYKRKNEIKEYAKYLMEKVGISHLAKRYPGGLSGGECRRIAIARALVNRPKLLLADEPTSDLDKDTTASIMKLFQKIREEGVSILMVTHDARTLSYADVNYEMEEGVLRKQQMGEKYETIID